MSDSESNQSHRWLLRCGIASAASLFAIPAHADWQYTKWGMSAAEVVAASGDTVKSLSIPEDADDGRKILARGTYTLLAWSTPVWFEFAAGKLTRVAMQLDSDAKCYALRTKLDEQYGRPFSSTSNFGVSQDSWKDAATGNRVRLLTVTNTCFLSYEPLDSPSGSTL